MKTCMTQLLSVGLLLAVTISASHAQAPLRWKLQKDQTFQLQMKQQTNSVVTLSSKKLTSTVDLQVNVTWAVQSADDEKFVIEQTIDSIRIEMKGADQNPVAYNSLEKKAVVGAAKDLATAVAPLLGAKFNITMNSQGAISAAAKVSPERNEAPGEAAKVPALSKEAVEQLLLQSLLPLPKEALANDQSWTDERRTKAALGDVKQKRTFTLVGNEDRGGIAAAKINVKGELEITAPAASKAAAKLKEQSHTGTVWFAKEAGRLIAAETTQRLVTESMYRDSTIAVDLTTTLSTTFTLRE